MCTKRTADVVLLNFSTNKMLLFIQMWHQLVIFIFYFFADSEIHTYIYIDDIISLVRKDHISSPTDVNNNFSWERDGFKQKYRTP